MLAGVGIVHNQVSTSVGGLTYSSDQITYPNGLSTASGGTERVVDAAVFRSYGVFSDNHTVFKVHGSFSSADPANGGRPTLANVYIDLA